MRARLRIRACADTAVQGCGQGTTVVANRSDALRISAPRRFRLSFPPFTFALAEPGRQDPSSWPMLLAARPRPLGVHSGFQRPWPPYR